MMKKFVAFFTILALSACIKAGNNVRFLGDGIIGIPQKSYDVSFYAQGERMISQSYISNYSPELNKMQTVQTGYTLASNKIIQKTIFEESFVKPNKSGYLSGASMPYKVYASEIYKLVGETVIDGKRYALLPMTDNPKDGEVLLVTANGEISPMFGRVKKGDLYIIDKDSVMTPADVRMVPLKMDRTQQTVPVKGFEIKYGGVKLDQIVLLYLDYGNSRDNKGQFETIYVPNKEGIINVHGVGLKVLYADENKMDYMVLKY